MYGVPGCHVDPILASRGVHVGRQADSYSKLKAACFVNLALLAQKEHDLTDSFKWCEKALR